MVIDLFESASDRNDDRPTWAADARKRRFRAVRDRILWTTLAATSTGCSPYAPSVVHGHRMGVVELDQLQDRLAVLLNPNSQWRHSARELVALAAIRADDLETATSTLEEILNDAESLQSVRARAEILKTLVDGRSANE